MEIKDIIVKLNASAEKVASHLLPNGQLQRNEWVVGSANGESGKSCKVCVSGKKVGVWSDFATGESGDLLDLWCRVKSISLIEALNQARDFLGIQEHKKQQQHFTRPQKPPNIARPRDRVLEYLMARNLTIETINAYKVCQHDGCILFPYLRNDELIMHKHLKIERENGKKVTWVSKDSEPCLFGWQVISKHSRQLVITEGELDAMSMYQYGWPAVSVPLGAGTGAKHSWIEYEWDNLDRFDRIYLVFDMDREGDIAKQDVAKRLGIHRCHIVDLPHKDANECLENGITPLQISTCMLNARTIDPDELKRPTHFRQQIIDRFFPVNGQKAGFDLPWEKTVGRIRVYPGEVSVWAGYNGSGKSLMLGQVIRTAVANGERSCIASFEMSGAKTLSRMITQVYGRSPTELQVNLEIDYLNENVWIFDLVGTAKSEKMLEVFQYAARRYGIKQFVVDSLAKLGMAEDDYAGQKKTVEALTEFAAKHEVHVHLVAHARKGADEFSPPRKMDIKGTGAITDMVDNVYLVYRNKVKERDMERLANGETIKGRTQEDIEAQHDTMLICDKNREDGCDAEGTYGLYFDKRRQLYVQQL